MFAAGGVTEKIEPPDGHAGPPDSANPTLRTAHIQDTDNLYADIDDGTLPAVSWVISPRDTALHMASSSSSLCRASGHGCNWRAIIRSAKAQRPAMVEFEIAHLGAGRQ